MGKVTVFSKDFRLAIVIFFNIFFGLASLTLYSKTIVLIPYIRTPTHINVQNVHINPSLFIDYK